MNKQLVEIEPVTLSLSRRHPAPIRWIALLLLGTSLCLLPAPAIGQERIDVDKTASAARLIPVSLSGITGEAAATLRFDLEIQGFRFETPDAAQYQISGSNQDNLIGRVTDRINKALLLNNQYQGSSLRSQAHAFADDIVEKLTGRKGISRYKIAFKVDTGRTSEIYVADFDGHNATQVTRDGSIVAAPCWVPGRRALFYTSYRLGNPDIYSHDLQSLERAIVARYSGLNTSAAVSPDGRRVAMIISKEGSPDLYVANADGTHLKQLTRTKEDESSPCWSPDGRTLCVVSRQSGRAALYLIGADGGELRRLRTDGAINTTEPDWSPDGKSIVFTAQMGGFQLFTVPAGGGEAVSTGAAGEDPSWAANSRNVIFARRVSGRRVLSVLDVPSKQVKDIARLTGSCSQPSWAK
jgi:TolB protein